ncbi:MAG: hypothetical protein ABIH23_21730 [bacterium]
MKSFSASLFLCMAVLLLIYLGASAAEAETFDLTLKKLPDQSQLSDELFRTTHTEYIRFELRGSSAERRAAVFAEHAKKEPQNYQCDQPFREVVQLGSEYYPFVFDSTDLRSNGYDRMYFDRNHNGDLTDDGVIEANPYTGSSSTSIRCEFPRVDLSLNVDGDPFDYAFFPSVSIRLQSGKLSSAYVLFRSAAYREGEIRLDGKKLHIALLDFNSNGRFDDQYEVVEGARMSSGEVYPTQGDLFLLDPDTKNRNIRGYSLTGREERHPLSKTLCVDGNFYDVEVTPSGNKVTLTLSPRPTGHIKNPNDGYAAVVYGDEGIVKIAGDKDQPVVLPVGDWRLLEYTITPTKKLSTYVSAAGTGDSPSVPVREGETAEFLFGPPYKGHVNVSEGMGSGTDLDLQIIGSGGEICTDLQVNGSKPDSPLFMIATEEGQIVQRGNFKYG